MFTRLITTADRYTEKEATHNGIIDSSKVNVIKDLQTIVSVSEQATARDLKVGDTILLDFGRYAQMKQKKDSLKATTDEFYNNVASYNIPIIMINLEEHLFVDISDVQLVVEEHEFIDEGEGFITGGPKDIINTDKKLILL